MILLYKFQLYLPIFLSIVQDETYLTSRSFLSPAYGDSVTVIVNQSLTWYSRRSGDHTETIELTYDTTKTDYGELLKMFWANHDPRVSKSRQYMSAIFYFDEEQKKLAELSLAEEEERKPGVRTLILPIGTFYEAEK